LNSAAVAEAVQRTAGWIWENNRKDGASPVKQERVLVSGFLLLDQAPFDPDQVADWPTKRAWVDYAFNEFAAAGYTVSSAYTVVRDPAKTKFVYRDSLWRGADMFGTGVASFGHVNNVHVQNVDNWEKYVETLGRGELPLNRALPVAPHQSLLREMMLQLKTGRLQTAYFERKFGANIVKQFADSFGKLAKDGFLTVGDGGVELTRDGLLQVDRLLPTFFESEHRGTRYT